MPDRICDKCGEPLEPVMVAENLKPTTAILYADNLWAIDGMANLRRAWACRSTCGEPALCDDTANGIAEWVSSNNADMKRLGTRPWRSAARTTAMPDQRETVLCPGCRHAAYLTTAALDEAGHDGEISCQSCGALSHPRHWRLCAREAIDVDITMTIEEADRLFKKEVLDGD